MDDAPLNLDGRGHLMKLTKECPLPRTWIDNAIKQAFREVFGWCPIHDQSPYEQHVDIGDFMGNTTAFTRRFRHKKALPKTTVNCRDYQAF